MKILNSIKYVYQSEDLNGDRLVAPVRDYHNSSGVFAEKISQSTGPKRAVWRISQCAVSCFAYPTLALLAGAGMVAKVIDTRSIRRINEAATEEVRNKCELLQQCSRYVEATSYCNELGVSTNWRMKTVAELTIQLTSEDDTQEICGADLQSPAPRDSSSKKVILADEADTDIRPIVELWSNKFRRVHVVPQGDVQNGVGTFTFAIQVRERISCPATPASYEITEET